MNPGGSDRRSRCGSSGECMGVGCCVMGEGVAVMRQWPGESELVDWPCATSIAFSKYCQFASRHHNFPAKPSRYPSFSFVLAVYRNMAAQVANGGTGGGNTAFKVRCDAEL